jgi:hypothetical protein
MTRYNDDMVDELADLLETYVSRSGRHGLRLELDWVAEAVDDDLELAAAVLRRAGFEPPEAAVWTAGRGGKVLGNFCHPPVLADKLTDVLDRFDPV